MAPRSAPFNIILHYTGKKSTQQILNEVHKFYLSQIKSKLTDSHLEIFEKQEVIDRLIDAYSCKPSTHKIY